MPYSTGLRTPLSNFEAGENRKDAPDPAITVRSAGSSAGRSDFWMSANRGRLQTARCIRMHAQPCVVCCRRCALLRVCTEPVACMSVAAVPCLAPRQASTGASRVLGTHRGSSNGLGLCGPAQPCVQHGSLTCVAGAQVAFRLEGDADEACLVAWTTTPWCAPCCSLCLLCAACSLQLAQDDAQQPMQVRQRVDPDDRILGHTQGGVGGCARRAHSVHSAACALSVRAGLRLLGRAALPALLSRVASRAAPGCQQNASQ